jgi:hypothetical protein
MGRKGASTDKGGILEENEERSAMRNHSQGCDKILDPGLRSGIRF